MQRNIPRSEAVVFLSLKIGAARRELIPESRVQTETGEMPAKKKGKKQKQHLRGVSAKEQRQYEHIKESAEKEGRYGNRAKEVAARTVLKQHKDKGHKKGQ